MPDRISDIQIIGEGNVAYHLAKGFAVKTDFNKIKVLSRNQSKSGLFNSISNKISTGSLDEFDSQCPLTIIAISDDAIPHFVASIVSYQNLIVHTAGSVSTEVFEQSGFKNYGSFYPLQTFSLNKDLDWNQIPIFINANNPESLILLETVAKSMSLNVNAVNDEQRLSIHIAAVLVNNFVNELYNLSDQWLSDHNLDFNLLIPLIQETVDKVKQISPFDAQTGPALRNDVKVLDKHLEQLSGKPQIKEIYKLLTASIQKSHNN